MSQIDPGKRRMMEATVVLSMVSKHLHQGLPEAKGEQIATTQLVLNHISQARSELDTYLERHLD